MPTDVIAPVQWVKALLCNSKTNIQKCILNISCCAKKTSFAPEMYLIMIMATDIYIILALKQRGEHELERPEHAGTAWEA
jgi:hypothetical protein